MNKISILFLLLLFSMICHAQDITGSYRYKSSDLSESRTIIFSQNSFNEERVGDLTSKIGTGSYSIHNNELTLKYKEVQSRILLGMRSLH